jgi:hypothetical protein
MQVKAESQSVLAKEIRIIPAWAWVLAAITFIGSQVAFDILMPREPKHPPGWAIPLFGLLMGLLLSCYLLILGYVNRDAKRRGMSPILWTIVAVFIPNGLGFLLYFVLRQPLRSLCPQCGRAVESGFSFCPRCSYKLSPSCPRCQRVVGVNDVYCPYCGTSLRNQAVPVSNTTTRVPD